jgi:hypothetical protein
VAGLFGWGRRSSEAGGGLAGRAQALARAPSLPSGPELAALVAAVRSILDSESQATRPRDSLGRPGGLVQLPELPTLILPDLHARPSFIASALAWKPPRLGRSMASLLEEGRACLVSLGDVFHSEAGNAARRWAQALREYASGWESHSVMDQEMGLCLAAATILLEAKRAFPAHCHYLKGNHENIADEEGGGDHSFYKFVVEGEMVASWFLRSYGPELLASYRELEHSLPLLVLAERFVASHGEPAFALSRRDLVDYRSRPDVVEALIWTGNGDAEAGSVRGSLEALMGADRARGARWFAGHRPVAGRYALRAGGRFVQFHDPAAHRVVFLEPGRDPDPDRDIFDLGD